jgi:Holliday junction resolvase-like predicted endonuclease
MINHFPTEQAAIDHLKAKGFKRYGKKWLSSCGQIDAWLVLDPARGPYIQFIADWHI